MSKNKCNFVWLHTRGWLKILVEETVSSQVCFMINGQSIGDELVTTEYLKAQPHSWDRIRDEASRQRRNCCTPSIQLNGYF